MLFTSCISQKEGTHDGQIDLNIPVSTEVIFVIIVEATPAISSAQGEFYIHAQRPTRMQLLEDPKDTTYLAIPASI